MAEDTTEECAIPTYLENKKYGSWHGPWKISARLVEEIFKKSEKVHQKAYIVHNSCLPMHDRDILAAHGYEKANVKFVLVEAFLRKVEKGQKNRIFCIIYAYLSMTQTQSFLVSSPVLLERSNFQIFIKLQTGWWKVGKVHDN